MLSNNLLPLVGTAINTARGHFLWATLYMAYETFAFYQSSVGANKQIFLLVNSHLFYLQLVMLQNV
jgi:hypothetical protein